tara:strand:+ start:3471 stop:4511 length:1041 start_codon:yes stop_codon:yes gene_type:complete
MLDNISQIAIHSGGSVTPLIIPSELTGGTGLCNVSVYLDENGDLLANIRHVHYTLYHAEFQQKFYCKWGCLAYLNPEDDLTLTTGNYLCKLDRKTHEILEFRNIDTSKHDIKPIWSFVGLEDARIFRWDNQLYICGVRRDVYDNGQGRMELCEVNWTEDQCIEQTRERIQHPSQNYLEKNWMPILDMPFHFLKWTNPLEIVKVNLHDKGKEKVKEGILDTISCETVISKDNFKELPWDLRGSSQVVKIDGLYTCITHEVNFFHHEGDFKDAFYYHRFVMWDEDWNLVKISKQFQYMGTRIEFTCGLTVDGDDLLITFGYQDNAAFIMRWPKHLLDRLEWEDLDKLK